jgi:hypothetical protein
VLRQVVDVGSADLGTGHSGCAGHVRCVRGDEVLGKMVEDGCESVILVKSRKSTGSQLDTVSSDLGKEFSDAVPQAVAPVAS